MKLSDFPPHIRQQIDPSMNPALLPGVTTEAREKARTKSEREAQKEIGQFLQISGIEFICPPMNRASALPEGWPDFTFARKGQPMALEVKVGGEQPKPHQGARHEAMRRNGWKVHVVHGAGEVKDIFRALDATKKPIDNI
jgi:hypothetical protein